MSDKINNTQFSKGVANILMIGSTGVGKSTLINAVFGASMAETGQGTPVTQEAKRYSKHGNPVAIYDTKGLELKDYKKTLREAIEVIKIQNKEKNLKDHIHIAWLCIAEAPRRVQPAEKNLVDELINLDIKVIVVITTAVANLGFKEIIRKEIPNAQYIMRVNSNPYEMDDDITIPIKGISELINKTLEIKKEIDLIIDERRKNIDNKLKLAHSALKQHSAIAATIGASPIPFSDFTLLVPNQVAMLARISACFDLELTEAFLGTLASGTLTASIGTVLGIVASSSLKAIPGVGTITGSLIDSTLATSITASLGKTYIETLHSLLKNNPNRILTNQEIADALKKNKK